MKWRGVVTACALGFSVNTSLNAAIINGGFDTGDLTGWTYSGPVSVQAIGGTPPAAVLEEDESLVDGTNLRQIFEIPVGRSPNLTFTFAMMVGGESPRVFPPDAFLVSLLDPSTLEPLLSNTGYSDLLAVEFTAHSRTFRLDHNQGLVGVADLADLTTADAYGVGGVVTLALNSLAAGTQVLLDFKLAGGFDGFHSRVVIDRAATGVAAYLDIKPGSCPNAFQVKDLGRTPIVVVGDALFDATQVDIRSIALSRADGVGGVIRPVSYTLKDEATPFTGELCGCHVLTRDGTVDLWLAFSSATLADVLGLSTIRDGTFVRLTVAGTFQDSTTFTVSDCIRIGRVRGK